MTTYVFRDGKVEEKSEYERRAWAVGIISDTMDATKHMATGRMIDSKAKFRAETRAARCVEIGNEPIKPRDPIKLDRRQRREDIGRAIYELRNKSVSR